MSPSANSICLVVIYCCAIEVFDRDRHDILRTPYKACIWFQFMLICFGYIVRSYCLYVFGLCSSFSVITPLVCNCSSSFLKPEGYEYTNTKTQGSVTQVYDSYDKRLTFFFVHLRNPGILPSNCCKTISIQITMNKILTSFTTSHWIYPK